MLIEIERNSGTSSLFSVFANELLRVLEEEDDGIKRAIQKKYHYEFLASRYEKFHAAIMGWP